MKKSLLFVAALAFATSALAQQFKWVDKDGKVQYGDTPPPGVKATRLQGPASGSAPGSEIGFAQHHRFATLSFVKSFTNSKNGPPKRSPECPELPRRSKASSI